MSILNRAAMEIESGCLDAYFAKTLLGKACTEGSSQFLSELMKGSREGHLCMRREAIALPAGLVEEGKDLFPKAPIVRDGDRYYLQKNWVYETYVLQQAARLRNRKPAPFYDASIFERELEKEEKLLPEQREAIRHAFAHPFSLICGGPGTGKTYTAGHLVRLLSGCVDKTMKPRYRICLAAPTGKAALHLHSTLLSQAVECQSSTLHRLLNLQPGEIKLFSGKRIDADLVLVDEASMIDVPLLAHLLEAIGEETRLVLMGDPDQLPPVEAGSLFAEFGDLFAVRLKRCMRTEKAALQASAKAIQMGDEEAFFASIPLHDFDDRLIERLYEKIEPLISSEKPDPAACIKHYNRCRVLNALRQGPFGTDALNRQILERMANRCKPGQWWAVPILITANVPRLDLYNGSSGVLIGQKTKGLQLAEGTAYFPEKGGLQKIPPFEVSFCLSIHKSQGSEFDEVLALFPKGSENFGREALYTAATRAKMKWEAIGEKEILRKMLSQRSRRMSGFTERSSIIFGNDRR